MGMSSSWSPQNLNCEKKNVDNLMDHDIFCQESGEHFPLFNTFLFLFFLSFTFF
jgi:hypothetical protein